MRIPTTTIVFLLLGACASYDGRGLKPGDSPSQVRAVMGAPALTFDEGPRSTWVYAHGAMGFDTFMFRFGESGTLERIDSVKDARHFARIQAGMTREEVLRVLGPASRTQGVRWHGDDVWDYRFMDAWGYPSYFSVALDRAGRVTQVVTWRESYFDDH